MPGTASRADGAPAARARRPDGQGPGCPAPFDAGPPRPGVHLHWAMPDALLRGTLAHRAARTGSTCRRCPTAGSCCGSSRREAPGAGVRGWVIEADTARVVAARPTGRRAPRRRAPRRDDRARRADRRGRRLARLGGDYDATSNRFALHDPLDDLASVAPNGVEGDRPPTWSPAGGPTPGSTRSTAPDDRPASTSGCTGSAGAPSPEWRRRRRRRSGATTSAVEDSVAAPRLATAQVGAGRSAGAAATAKR